MKETTEYCHKLGMQKAIWNSKGMVMVRSLADQHCFTVVETSTMQKNGAKQYSHTLHVSSMK